MEAINLPETTHLKTGEDNALRVAVSYVIIDNTSHSSASNFLKTIKGLLGQISDAFDPLIDQAHKTHKAILQEKLKHTDLLDKAERIIKDKIRDYQKEQERLRLKAEREAQALAQKLAEEEALEQAVDLEINGDQESAVKAILDVVAPPVTVLSSVQKVEGVSSATVWKYQITSIQAIVEAVARGELPNHCLIPNAGFWNNYAKGIKKSAPGVTVWSEQVIRSGRGE